MPELSLKKVTKIEDESLELNLISKYVEFFYKRIMKARIRKIGKSVRIHHSRDWEYPWVLLQSKAKPKEKVLDCGSGYSPLPFLWSSYGLEVHAVDRDTLVCTKTKFALLGIKKIFFDILKGPNYLYKKSKIEKYENKMNDKKNSFCKQSKYKTRLQKVFGHLNCYFQNLETYFSRAIKPDFWGPIPPKLIKKYKIIYKNGEKGDFTKLNYPEDFFDIVTCVSVLEHMPYEDRLKGLTEMCRVLKKGGRLIITFDVKNETEGKNFANIFLKNFRLKIKEIVFLDRKINTFKKHSNVVGMSLVK